MNARADLEYAFNKGSDKLRHLNSNNITEKVLTEIIQSVRRDIRKVALSHLNGRYRKTQRRRINHIPSEMIQTRVKEEEDSSKKNRIEYRKAAYIEDISNKVNLLVGTRSPSDSWRTLTRLAQDKRKGFQRPSREDCEREMKAMQVITEKEKKQKVLPTPQMGNHPFNNTNISNSIRKLTKAIKNLGKYKAAGPSGIPNALLRLSPNVVATYLSLLYQKILDSKIMPEILLEATITLIPKKGQGGNSYKDFRPISVTDFELQVLTKFAIREQKKALEEDISNY
jgi:hypothetical protein